METKDNNKGIFSVCLEFTGVCKVGCPYCLLEKKVAETSKEQILDIIHILVEYGVKRFSLGGGEPLEISYIYEIGRIIRNHGRLALLRTSACNLMDYQMSKESFDIIDISIDSYKLSTLKICKPNIDGNIPLQNIKQLVKMKIPVRCNILVTQYNIEDVIPTIKWLNANGVCDVRIQKLVPRGKARAIYDRLTVSDALFKEIVDKSIDVGSSLGMKVSELKTVNSQTLCIVKPNGKVYVGTPTGIIEIGNLFSMETLNVASSFIYENQRKYYMESRDV